MSGWYSTSYFLQDICRWIPPWYTVDYSKYPLVLCRQSSVQQGTPFNWFAIYHCLIFFETVLFSVTLLLTFFATLNEPFLVVLLFLLEEGPNNWSSCCTFKKTGENGWMLDETDVSVYVAEVIFYFLNHPIRHTQWTGLTE